MQAERPKPIAKSRGKHRRGAVGTPGRGSEAQALMLAMLRRGGCLVSATLVPTPPQPAWSPNVVPASEKRGPGDCHAQRRQDPRSQAAREGLIAGERLQKVRRQADRQLDWGAIGQFGEFDSGHVSAIPWITPFNNCQV